MKALMSKVHEIYDQCVDQHIAMTKRLAALDGREAVLDERERKVADGEAALAKRAEQIGVMEDIVAARDAADARIVAADRREKELTEKIAAFGKLEADFKASQENDAFERSAAYADIARKRADLDAATKALDAEKRTYKEKIIRDLGAQK